MAKPPHPTKRKLGIYPRKFKINSANIDDGQYFYVYCEQLKKVQITDIHLYSNQVEWSHPFEWDVDTKNNWIWIRAHPKAALVAKRKLLDDDGDLTVTITFTPPDTEDVVYGDVEYEPEDLPVSTKKTSKRKKQKTSNKKAKPAAKDHSG